MLKRFYILALAANYALCSPQSPESYVDIERVNGKRVCTVWSIGNNQSDVINIQYALHKCGSGGIIVFPENQNYWIGERLHAVGSDLHIEWRGQWTVCAFGIPLSVCVSADGFEHSFQITWTIGGTTLTLLLSKIIMLASF